MSGEGQAPQVTIYNAVSTILLLIPFDDVVHTQHATLA